MVDGPVATALVGYGYWGANLARNIDASPTTRLVGICDSAGELRTRAATRFDAIEMWSDFGEMLADPGVAAVVIATPASFHAEMALAAIESGRHVLVEKPLAMNSADAGAVVKAADEAGVIAMVGHTFLYARPVERLKSLVDSGELGNIQYLYSQRLSLSRIRRDCNALWNFAPHDVSIMLHLLGQSVSEVSARGHSFIGPGVDDVCFASLTFENGVAANLHVSWIDPRKTRLMTVVGDEKMVIYNDVSADQKLWVVDSGVARDAELGRYESVGDFQWRTRSGDIHIPRIEMEEPLLLELGAFGAACQSGEQPLTDAAHGAEVVSVLEAIDESTRRHGAPVEPIR